LDRLTQADHPTMPPPLDSLPDVENFTYDGVGDRTMTGYAHDANHRMRASPGHTYDYDDDGNLVVRDPNTPGQVTYSWDLDNRLLSHSNADGAASYAYDPSGRRLRSGTQTEWALWTEARPLANYSSTGARMRRSEQVGRWTEARTEIGSSLPAEFRLEVHADRLDAPRLLTSPDGAPQWRATYSAYGKAFPDADPDGNQVTTAYPTRLPGQTEDVATGLHYNRARYLDPSVGAYLSPDPLLRLDSRAKHSYVDDNPTNLSDPMGLTWASNAHFLFDWLLGVGGTSRTYTDEDVELSEMRESPGAAALRAKFARRGCRTLRDFAYDSGTAWWETLVDPETADWTSTAAQVGGFAGASATNNGDGTVTYHIPNVGGTHSFFYHAAPDRSSLMGPMRNIYQDFTWTERLSQCGCSRRD
jgi:RHS repeat-associated protein